MSLWKKPLTLPELNELCKETAVAALGIEFTELTESSLEAKMPVDRRTKQPFGVLHGGASALLAETLASMAAHLACEPNDIALGIELNASHLVAVREGHITGKATAVNLGRTLQVWAVELRDDRNRLVCLARLTAAIRANSTPTT